MPPTYIYGLIDLRTFHIGYVGASQKPLDRFNQHRGEPGGKSTARASSRKHQWLSAIRKEGIEPALVILARVPSAKGPAAERDWIARLRQLGQAQGNGHDRPIAAATTHHDGMTVAQVAAQMGVTRQRVHQLIQRHGITPRRVLLGARLFVLSPTDVAALSTGRRDDTLRRST